MADTENTEKGPGPVEPKGLVTDVVVPIAQGAAGGATGAWVAGKLGQAKRPPPPSGDKES